MATKITSKEHSQDSWPSESWLVIVPTVFLSILVWEVVFVRTLMPIVRSWATRQKFYASLINRPGYFASKGQDDIILMLVLALHHLCSGSLALVGHWVENVHMFRLGILLELGFEISDTLAICFGQWPHEPGKETPLLNFAMLAHHLPGLFLAIPIIYTGADGNPHVRALVSWLLFAGGVSALAGGFVHTRNFQDAKEMTQAALAQTIGGIFFIYARFAAFPWETYHFVRDLQNENGARWLSIGVQWMAVAMMTFNLILLRHNLTKTLKYTLKAMGLDVTMNDLRHPNLLWMKVLKVVSKND